MRTSLLLAVFGVLSAPALPAAAGGIQPMDLRCEHRIDPLGIGAVAPRLGWRLSATDPGARSLRQSAYEIQVASSKDTLAAGQADTWDSGEVSSDRTVDVGYAGPALSSGEDCWWRVRVWDQDSRPSDWSPPSHWTMALLRAGEWRAQWIGLDAQPGPGALDDAQRSRLALYSWATAPIPASHYQPLTLFVRRGFTLPANRRLARLTLIVLPYSRCTIALNGREVGEAALWNVARPIDLTGAASPGDNVLGLKIVQEDGYAPAAFGELEIDFADGGFVRLPIDPTWHYATSAPTGWDRPGFDAAHWATLQTIADFRSPWGRARDLLHFLFFAPSPYLRTSFSVVKPVRRATLYATALGVYEASLNGRRVGHDFFTPGWTDYAHRVQYQTYDVTAALQPGPNTFGAILGDGWYAGTAGATGRRHIYGGYPRFAAQLEIDYADGSHQTVITDGSWRGAFGPIRQADLMLGCDTDLRRAPSGWRPVAIGLRQVDPAVPLADQFILEPATIDPVRASAPMPARNITEPEPGVYVADFGQNLVGWVRIRVRGRAGERVVVRHGEMLNPNGSVYTTNLRSATATDVYWLAGNGEEVLEPHFTFHGFRYAEITGLAEPPKPEDLTAIVVGSPMERTGEFHSSNPLLNQLYHNIIWGQRGNYLEAPTDCPQRDERLGWTGDTQFFIPTAAYNFDVSSFIERWLVTLTDDQGKDGTFPDVAPATTHLPHAVTGWGDAAIVCTYRLWQAYGDTEVIRRHFASLARYIDWLQVSAQGDVLSVGGYEDWLNLGGGANSDVIDTAYGAYLCGLMSQMAAAIDRPADAARFAALRAKFVKGFRDHFVLPDGRIWDSSQTGFALAFTMNLLPEEIRAKAADDFVADLAARGWHLATGFIGTPRLLPALHLAGRDDAAYRLLLQDTFPSWLFPVTQGATTMWERWDGWTPERGFETPWMNSFNHYAFGAVGEYLYREILGIDSDGPGFRRILIRPVPGGGLTAAAGSYDAITGRIESSWTLENGRFRLTATLPPNTSGTILLPDGSRHPVGSGTYRLECPWPAASPSAQ